MKKYLILGFVAVLACVGATTLVTAQSVPAKIDWSRAEVLEFLLPSEQRRVTLTFRPSQNVVNAELVVSPSLAGRVTISPQSFKQLDAKKDAKVTLTLKAPSMAEVKFTGTLHLRSVAPGTAPSTLAEPLPVAIVVHGKPVPPDPGEAGKQTIAGVDADGDGVRDDFQRYLTARFLDNSTALAAGRQYGVALQAALLDANPTNPLALAERVLSATYCLAHTLGVRQAHDLKANFHEQYLNTSERRSRYDTLQFRLRGAQFSSPQLDELSRFCVSR